MSRSMKNVILACVAIWLLAAAAIVGCGCGSGSTTRAQLDAVASATDRLSTNKASVEVTGLPAGTEHVGVAVMPKLTSTGSEIKYLVVSPSTLVLTPGQNGLPATGDPVIDIQAWTGKKAGEGKAIGGWAGRLQTVPGGIEPPPPPPPPPTTETTPPPPPPPPPPPATIGTLGGIVGCCWGGLEKTDFAALHPAVVRGENPSAEYVATWEGLGAKVLALINHYVSGGIVNVNTTEYVGKVVSFVKAHPRTWAVEVENEPGGQWFAWGSNAESTANREAYGRLVIAVDKALVSNFGTGRPLELCSFDGGHDSSNAWGKGWMKVPGALAACDGVTNHPYGGTGSNSKFGNRALVEESHAVTGKPVYVTELGFPTGNPNGDSRVYTETESAWSIYNFDTWANSTGYVPVVTTYGYRDSKEGGGYGVVTHSGTRKKAFTALQEYLAGKACTVCS